MRIRNNFRRALPLRKLHSVRSIVFGSRGREESCETNERDGRRSTILNIGARCQRSIDRSSLVGLWHFSYSMFDNYRFEASVETSGDTAVRKFLDTGSGAGGGRRSRGGGGGALRALLQLQSCLLRWCAGIMGGGRRRGAVVRPGGIQQHLQRRDRVQLRRFLVHFA